MLEKRCNAFFINNNIVFFDNNFGRVTFFANEMSIFSVDFDKVYLDVVNFFENDPETQRINACSRTSIKMVGLVFVRSMKTWDNNKLY